ncbi:MAG: ABC transporter ATP-binding protein [Pseudomonadota bacterium]
MLSPLAAAPPNTQDAVIDVRDLDVDLKVSAGRIRVVDDLSFSIRPGEIFGVVGESGSGKSMTALAIMGLLPQPAGRVARGTIHFDGADLAKADAETRRGLRGDAMAMIFQEPMTSLNPVLKVGFQIGEALRIHRGASRSEAQDRAVALLRRVGIANPERTAADYPHRLSGGMRQRAMIAMAMACKPRLLIADEPTTALDVTIQAQVLDLIDELRRQERTAVLMITHNFGIIAQKADRVAVMYAGEIVEEASAAKLLDGARHPYTQGLLASVPRLGVRKGGRPPRLSEIPGMQPDVSKPREGCAFAPRCPLRVADCTRARPPLLTVDAGHRVRCIVNGRPSA